MKANFFPRRAWTLAALVLAASSCSQESEVKDAGLASQVVAQDTGVRAGGDADSAALGVSRSNSEAAARSNQQLDNLMKGYKWDPLQPGVAANKEDADWLDRHGYPDEAVFDRLSSLSLVDLKHLADSGNKPAQAVYAYRLASAGGSPSDVQSILMKSAADGSLYALKMAGDIYMAVPGYRDNVMASAYYGLLASNGDQAGFVQGYLVDSQLSAEERLRARAIEEALGTSLSNMSGLSESEAAAGNGVRPGYDDFVGQVIKGGQGG